VPQQRHFELFAFEGARQGDQIGRIFAHWAIVVFGQFLVNYRSSPHFLLPFSQLRSCINFNKKQVGPHFGRFFENSSGHPVGQSDNTQDAKIVMKVCMALTSTISSDKISPVDHFRVG
jgi:hypothetical protein